jgi:hypothetical protein
MAQYQTWFTKNMGLYPEAAQLTTSYETAHKASSRSKTMFKPALRPSDIIGPVSNLNQSSASFFPMRHLTLPHFLLQSMTEWHDDVSIGRFLRALGPSTRRGIIHPVSLVWGHRGQTEIDINASGNTHFALGHARISRHPSR